MWEQWGVEVGAEEKDGEDNDTGELVLVDGLPAATADLSLVLEVFALSHKSAATLWTPTVDPREPLASERVDSDSERPLHPYATDGCSSSMLARKIADFRRYRKSKTWKPLATFVTKRWVT